MRCLTRTEQTSDSSGMHVAAPDHPSERAADALAARAVAGSGGPRSRGATRAVDAAPAAAVASTLGHPLPADVRAFFEPSLGFDFAHVRIHTDETSAAAAQSLDARAFQIGRHIAFAGGHYEPGTQAGRRLIAHELAHVAQDGGDTTTVRREVPWEAAQRRREHAPSAVPAGFSYELQDHRLIAHTTALADVDLIIAMLDVLSLYARIEIDAGALRTALTAERAGRNDGDRVSIDVTQHLPPAIRSFLARMEAYFAAWRAYRAEHGTPEELFARTRTAPEEERTRQVNEYWAGAPGRLDEWHAACHEFATAGTSGSPEGVTPGRGPTDPYNSNMDRTLDAYLSSIHGRGPYRPVPAANVQPGDIAVFRAGRAIPELPSRIIHSAIVIRVSAGSVELLEKTNPGAPAATRTVRQVLREYASESATVHYVAPALAGLPHTADRRIGDNPPSGTFTEDVGTTAPEDTHVLFRVNSHVLRPHEDVKLFRVIARTRAPRTVRVHGYASTEGDDTYNRNLSAHRAVSIKDGLQRELPSGSILSAIAHGETAAFGTPDENRRAGIELGAPVAAAAPGAPATPAAPERPREETR